MGEPLTDEERRDLVRFGSERPLHLVRRLLDERDALEARAELAESNVEELRAERWRLLAEMAADREAVRALVEALPRCTYCECPSTGKNHCDAAAQVCDEHACTKVHEGMVSRHVEHGHAPAFRALLERMKSWTVPPDQQRREND